MDTYEAGRKAKKPITGYLETGKRDDEVRIC
jgi:hypothetical protein